MKRHNEGGLQARTRFGCEQKAGAEARCLCANFRGLKTPVPSAKTSKNTLICFVAGLLSFIFAFTLNQATEKSEDRINDSVILQEE
jgi:hypothetical protein